MGMKLKIVINAYNMGICGTIQDFAADVILGKSARVAPHEFPAWRFAPYPHCSDKVWTSAPDAGEQTSDTHSHYNIYSVIRVLMAHLRYLRYWRSASPLA